LKVFREGVYTFTQFWDFWDLFLYLSGDRDIEVIFLGDSRRQGFTKYYSYISKYIVAIKYREKTPYVSKAF